MKLDKLVYTAQATDTGGRDGRTRTADGRVDVVLKSPNEMGGTGEGVNPKQLFAAHYSACVIGVIKLIAAKEKIAVPANRSITGLVGIGPIPAGFGLQVELEFSIAGMDERLLSLGWKNRTRCAGIRAPSGIISK